MLSHLTVLIAAAAEPIAAVAEPAHEAVEAAKSGGLPQLNAGDFAPQLFWLILTFGLLFLLMWRIALPRVGEVLEQRADRVKRDLEAAGRFKAETDQALAAYEKALADAKSNASAIARETRDKLAADTEAERTRVEGQLAGQLAEAEKRIQATKAKALASVNEVAAETAGALVSKLIGANVSVDEVKKVL